MTDDPRTAEPRRPEGDDIYYVVTIERVDPVNGTKMFQYDGYGLLRECLDDIEDEAAARGWFQE